MFLARRSGARPRAARVPRASCPHLALGTHHGSVGSVPVGPPRQGGMPALRGNQRRLGTNAGVPPGVFSRI